MDLLLFTTIGYAFYTSYLLESAPLLAVSSILFTCLAFGFMFIHPKRKEYFTKDFMKQFEEEHHEAFGKDSNMGIGEGYPDMGNGRYAKKLPYKQWFLFNVA